MIAAEKEAARMTTAASEMFAGRDWKSRSELQAAVSFWWALQRGRCWWCLQPMLKPRILSDHRIRGLRGVGRETVLRPDRRGVYRTLKMRSNYCQARRLDYIDWRLLTAGSVQRGDIKRQFGVSESQASADLAAFEREHPGMMRYDKSGAARAYVPATRKYRSVRGMTPAVLAAISALAETGHAMGWRD